jgi:hypothetical protein
MILEKLPDHTIFYWLGKKHLVNKDVEVTKVIVDPLTIYISYIYVNGDFHDAYNLFAIISTSPQKISPVAYYSG